MKQYDYEILSLYTAPSVDGLTNVVKRVTWRYQVKEDLYVADIYKDTYFDLVNPSAFTDYKDLTATTVFGWISTVENIDSIRAELDEKLSLVKSPTIVEKEIPWSRSINYTGQEKFVVTLNGTVISGPQKWSSGDLNKVLNQHGQNDVLPTDILAYKQGIVPVDAPLVLSDTLSIYQVGSIINDTSFSNILFEGTDIVWEYSTGKAVGTYQPTANSIEHIKTALKQNLRSKNMLKVETPIKVMLDGVEFSISATSWGRLFVVTKILRLADGESCGWWNNNIKVMVTKGQLMEMLVAIDDYIDSLWGDDEIPKIAAINSCTTIDQLKQIEV